MTASIHCFLVWPLPETAMGRLCNCFAGALPYTHYVIRPFSLCGVEVLRPVEGGALVEHETGIYGGGGDATTTPF